MANMIGLDLKVDEKYIEASVQEIVKSAITQALGDPTKIVKNAVDSAIGTYVNEEGKECRKDSYRARPYLDWLATKTIEETAREVMREVVEENKDLFKEEIKKQLSARCFRESVAESFVKLLIDNSENKWQMPVLVKFEPEK